MPPQDDINGIGVWLVWLCGGVFGVIILLLVICYCCLMPRHQSQKPHMEPCSHRESSKEIHWNMYHAPDIQIPRPPARPVSYAGHICHTNITPYYSEIPTYNMHQERSQERIVSHGYMNNTPTISEITAQYASSNMLDDMVSAGSEDSLKTRSLPAFLRSKQRPLSTEDDMYQLYAKVKFSKKRRNRMRNDDAAVIALSKSQSQCLNADAVIVYDERTAL